MDNTNISVTFLEGEKSKVKVLEDSVHLELLPGSIALACCILIYWREHSISRFPPVLTLTPRGLWPIHPLPNTFVLGPAFKHMNLEASEHPASLVPQHQLRLKFIIHRKLKDT